MIKHKVLIFDIETAPMTAYVWGLKDQNIGLNQITSDWYVLSWAAKWLGDSPSKTIYMDNRRSKDLSNDKQLLEGIWKLLDQADIVITQYGTGFDSPKLNSRFIMAGMKPPSPYRHLDTYRIAKASFAFTSNKLEYLTDTLCVKYKKLKHKKFPGMELWKQCLAGNRAAWDEMRRYNIHDVLATEELYTKLQAWASITAPKPVVITIDKTCEVCGKNNVYRQGEYVTKVGRYPKYHCQDCGAWRKGPKVKETK